MASQREPSKARIKLLSRMLRGDLVSLREAGQAIEKIVKDRDWGSHALPELEDRLKGTAGRYRLNLARALASWPLQDVKLAQKKGLSTRTVMLLTGLGRKPGRIPAASTKLAKLRHSLLFAYPVKGDPKEITRWRARVGRVQRQFQAKLDPDGRRRLLNRARKSVDDRLAKALERLEQALEISPSGHKRKLSELATQIKRLRSRAKSRISGAVQAVR